MIDGDSPLSLSAAIVLAFPGLAQHFVHKMSLAPVAVVYDGYVGYDYLFVPREEIKWRRHARRTSG